MGALTTRLCTFALWPMSNDTNEKFPTNRPGYEKRRHRLFAFLLQRPPCLSLSPSHPLGRFVSSIVSPSPHSSSVVFQDLGKSSNDLLSKDYPFHGTSLEVKTKTPSKVAFKVAGLRDSKTQGITGDLETKYADPKNGLVFTQTWTTSNVLKSQVELENYIAKGLKLDLSTSLIPDKGSKSTLFNVIYKQSGVHTRGAFDVFKVTSPSVPLLRYLLLFRV